MKITDPVQLFALGFTEKDLPNVIKASIFEDWIISKPIHWNEAEHEWRCNVLNARHGYAHTPTVELYLKKRFFGKDYVEAQLMFGVNATMNTGPK